MKRIAGYSLLALLCYCAFIVWLLPAPFWFALWQQSHPQWTAARLNGNILAGSLRQLYIADQRIGDIDWRWQPAGLLTGSIAYRLRWTDRSAHLEGNLLIRSDAELTCTLLDGALPLRDLSRWLSLPQQLLTAKLQPERLVIKIDSAQGRLLAADGLVKIDEVQVNNMDNMNLGAFQLQFQTHQEGIQGSGTDTSSPLALQALLTLRRDGGYQIRGDIAARATATEDIRTLLRLLGSPSRDGAYRFDFTGRFLM